MGEVKPPVVRCAPGSGCFDSGNDHYLATVPGRHMPLLAGTRIMIAEGRQFIKCGLGRFGSALPNNINFRSPFLIIYQIHTLTSMTTLPKFLLLAAGIALCSCDRGKSSRSMGTEELAGSQQFAINSVALQKDFDTWWKYTYNNINLSEDFIGLDVDSSIIKKADFLYRLTSGRVIPLKVMVRDSVSYYKLYPINEAQADIKSTMKQKAVAEIERFEMEGQVMPRYNFSDISGKKYSTSSTKGKIVVLKCWYIGCVACIEEFPEVNKLVDSYKDRDDILFVSLAMDPKKELVGFLKTNKLKYATVPNVKDFMQHQMNINSYPTHILIDRTGKIVKVVGRIGEIKPFIDKQLLATKL